MQRNEAAFLHAPKDDWAAVPMLCPVHFRTFGADDGKAAGRGEERPLP